MGPGRQPAITVPPIHLIGAIPRDCKAFHAERIDDPIEQTALLYAVQTSAPATLWRIVEVNRELRKTLLPGDVLVEWNVNLPYDILRVDNMLFWFERQSNGSKRYADPPVSMIRRHQITCIQDHIWSMHKSRFFTFACDPFGRALVMVCMDDKNKSYASASLLTGGHRFGDFFCDGPSATLDDEIHWLKTVSIHTSCWEGHDGIIVSAPKMEKAALVGEFVRLCRTKVRRSGTSGRTIRIQRCDDSKWWERLAAESEIDGVAQETASLMQYARLSWTAIDMTEFRQIMAWTGWREFDLQSPPFKVMTHRQSGSVMSGKRRTQQKKRPKDEALSCG